MVRCVTWGWGVWVSGMVRYMGVACLGKCYGALQGGGCDCVSGTVRYMGLGFCVSVTVRYTGGVSG